MVSATTQGIRVSVESFYLADRSAPDEQKYVFAYRITIENQSPAPVQLLRRHWVVTDGRNQVTEVYGDGVVGEQPVLAPGTGHTYTSGTMLETPAGTMEGTYEMRHTGAEGRSFRVKIPLFVLGKPDVLH